MPRMTLRAPYSHHQLTAILPTEQTSMANITYLEMPTNLLLARESVITVSHATLPVAVIVRPASTDMAHVDVRR
jgi:hypothetical protein